MKWAVLGFCAASLIGISTVQAADADVQIVEQGGIKVTLADIAAYLQHMPEDRWPGFLDSPKRVDQMIIAILRNKQLAQQAIDMKLDQDPDVKAEIAFSTMEVLSRRRMAAFDKLLVVPSMDVAAKEQYQAHQSDFTEPAKVEVQHILVASKDRSETEAKALAEKIRAEAIASPVQFDALVKKYSDDTSKDSNNGHIEEATSGKVVKEFAQAAGKLTKPGEISPVVRTQFGYHVLKLVRIEPAKQLPFAEVKDKIVAKLKQSYIAEQKQAFMRKLDEAQPAANPELTKVLHDRFVPAGIVSPTEAANATKP